MFNHERTLVVVAHPDDEVLGCGGTIARLAAMASDIRIVFLTDGVGARCESAIERKRASRTRWEHARGAAIELGVHDMAMLDIAVADNQADDVPRLVITRAIEDEIEVMNPTLILTHSGADLNVDHRRVHEAVKTATRPVCKPQRTVLAFEVPSSTEWGLSRFQPVLYVDISDQIHHKIAAMGKYVLEQPSFPHPRSEEAIRALAMWRGSTAGVHAAEAYEVIYSCW